MWGLSFAAACDGMGMVMGVRHGRRRPMRCHPREARQAALLRCWPCARPLPPALLREHGPRSAGCGQRHDFGVGGAAGHLVTPLQRMLVWRAAEGVSAAACVGLRGAAALMSHASHQFRVSSHRAARWW
jgi:hypothetical protein